MKSGGRWNFRGLRSDAVAAARDNARRSGMSVGEWLNSVAGPAEAEDDERRWSADAEEADRSVRRSKQRFRDREARPQRSGRGGGATKRWTNPAAAIGAMATIRVMTMAGGSRAMTSQLRGGALTSRMSHNGRSAPARAGAVCVVAIEKVPFTSTHPRNHGGNLYRATIDWIMATAIANDRASRSVLTKRNGPLATRIVSRGLARLRHGPIVATAPTTIPGRTPAPTIC
jgi:hypothetical protein